ncbi:MAG: ParB/RepB/Spo0J family partition protein [Nitrososphaerales archaeon]
MVDPIFTEVAVKDLQLDVDNPRFYHLRLGNPNGKVTDADLEKEIETDDDYNKLLDQVKGDGIIEPLWVVETKGGKYRVIEGNMRTTVLRNLIRSGVLPPKGVSYERVKAHVYPKGTPENILAVQRAVLQTGKKKWGAFNDAAMTYDLRTQYKMQPEQIAMKLGIPPSDVEERIQNFKLYNEFSQEEKIADPDKFSYFSSAPRQVRERFLKAKETRKQYYHLITPNVDGITRIKSVATRGGLREFAKICENEKILAKFLKNKKMTISDAYEELVDSDINLSLPFLKKLPGVARGLSSLTPEQIKTLKSQVTFVSSIKKIDRAVKRIL